MTASSTSRPTSVPREATWNTEENEWQLGVLRRTNRSEPHPTGEWRYWRADGSLACIAQFDDEGAQDGTTPRWHPDGTLASRGEWRQGDRFGRFVFMQSEHPTPEVYPEDKRTWRVEFDAVNSWSEEYERFFLRDGTECTSFGRPLSTPYDMDVVFAAASPASFLAKDGPGVFRALSEGRVPLHPSDVERRPAKDYPLGVAEAWGCDELPLRNFFRLFGNLGEYDLGNERIEPDDVPGYRYGQPEHAPNLMLWYLERSNGNYYESLGGAFAGAYRIGWRGDSDPWYAGLFDADAEGHPQPHVWFWSHESHGFDEPAHRSLDAFAWQLAIKGACEQERLSPGGREAMRPHDDCETSAPNTARFYWRAYWLIQLMDSHSVSRGKNGRLRDMGEVFIAHLNTPIDDALHRDRLDIGRAIPPTALYTMWRYFWFGHEGRLREALDAWRDAPARLTRDCVTLIEGLLAGRNELASIPDVQALRSELRSLNLDPDR